MADCFGTSLWAERLEADNGSSAPLGGIGFLDQPFYEAISGDDPCWEGRVKWTIPSGK
jgi:hypothetical protein